MCVHQGREGAGGILPPIPSSFQFSSPAFSSKARSYLLPRFIPRVFGRSAVLSRLPLSKLVVSAPSSLPETQQASAQTLSKQCLATRLPGAFWKQPPQFLPKAVPLLPHLSRLLRSGGRGGIPKHNSSLGRNASVLEPAVASPLPKAVRMVTA